MWLTLPLDMGTFTNNGQVYSVRDLIVSAGQQSTIPLASVLDVMYEHVWSDQNGVPLRPFDVLKWPERYPDHYERILLGDLSYPILVFENGVADGCHRICKAFLTEQRHILARPVNMG